MRHLASRRARRIFRSRSLLLLCVLSIARTLSAAPASAGPSAPQPAADAAVIGVIRDLNHADPRVKLRAVRSLKAADHPEAAVPLAQAVLDSDNDVQLEAIAAELNIFLADKVAPRKRVGFLVEVRGQLAAEPTFTAGPSKLGAHRVPLDVAMALARASTDDYIRVAVEALYAFGALAGEVASVDRPALLGQAAAAIVPIIGSQYPMMRLAAVRVAGRVFARRATDPPLDGTVGDAVVAALNDREDAIRLAAIDALGAMRYERSVQALSDLLRYYERGAEAQACFDALARIAHATSLPQFVAQLSARNQRFKLIAIEGLARAGDRARVAGIRSALNDDGDDALRLAGHFAFALLNDGSVDPVVEALSRSRLRDQAIQYVRELAFGRAGAFALHLQNPNPQVRREIVDALGLSGDSAAAAIVEPLTRDKAAEVSEAALRAVARLPPVRASASPASP